MSSKSQPNCQNSDDKPFHQTKKFILVIAIVLPIALFIITLIIMGNNNSSHSNEVTLYVQNFSSKWETIYQDFSEDLVQKEKKLQEDWELKFQNLSKQHEQSKKIKLQEWEDKIQGLLTKYDELEQEIIILKETNFSANVEDLEEQFAEVKNNFDKINEKISDLRKSEEIQDLKLRTLVNDNPFFIKTKASNSLLFVTARQIKCTQDNNSNALLDFPLQVNKTYSLQFQVDYTAFSPNIRLGVSIDNQDWTTHSQRFTKYEQGYGLSLSDGYKASNGTRASYAQFGLEQTGESITVKINTSVSGTISYSYGGVDQGPAFEKIDFSAVTYYPAVVLSQINDEVKFIGVEVANV